MVIGQKTNGVNTFLGIPYAAPPVGSQRWRPPQRYGFFPKLVLHASQFGSECTQSGGGSENCLFLNVYTPDPRTFRGLLPVMVWIHGGALVSGGGDIYDPTRLVQQGVIVVTINYRLGYLGFLAQSALDSEKHEAGNYGFMDQQFALTGSSATSWASVAIPAKWRSSVSPRADKVWLPISRLQLRRIYFAEL